MALYDGLPPNTPTKVGGDGLTYELWATRTTNGGTVETRLIGATATAQANQQAVTAALQQAITTFGGNFTNWSTLTTAQKDTAAKNVQLVIARIARYLLGQFDSAG